MPVTVHAFIQASLELLSCLVSYPSVHTYNLCALHAHIFSFHAYLIFCVLLANFNCSNKLRNKAFKLFANSDIQQVYT